MNLLINFALVTFSIYMTISIVEKLINIKTARSARQQAINLMDNIFDKKENE